MISEFSYTCGAAGLSDGSGTKAIQIINLSHGAGLCITSHFDRERTATIGGPTLVAGRDEYDK